MSTKLWGVAGVAEPASRDSRSPQPVSFTWVRGEMLEKRSDVFLGLSSSTGEILVAKRYTFDETETPGRPSARSIKAEVALLQHIRHPNLVEVFGFDEQSDAFHVLSEYVPGNTLRLEIHRRGQLAEDIVQSIASQLLDGLIHLHARGIVLGDLKSTKILVDPSGVCKIAGLGCSSASSSGSGEGSLVRRDYSRAVPKAIWWTAPEVVRGQFKAWSLPADIWSLGCVVLEMLTGLRPWFDTEAVAVMFKLYHQTLRPEVPPGIILSPVAADFLNMCLAVNPEDPMSAAELRKHPFLAQAAPFSGFNA
ncbi:Kinase-like protein [Mycena kentingensis (nom. inval.)]|nr:Kinase-like protein [Mycena kentingensis (nom. inval.)]